MDGSPQVVRFDATTLWHVDAAEWAPSTASFSSDRHCPDAQGMSALLRSLPKFGPQRIDAKCQNRTYAPQQTAARVAGFTRSPRRRGRAPKCRGRLSLPGLDRRGGVRQISSITRPNDPAAVT